jgi:hypothetical protein
MRPIKNSGLLVTFGNSQQNLGLNLHRGKYFSWRGAEPRFGKPPRRGIANPPPPDQVGPGLTDLDRFPLSAFVAIARQGERNGSMSDLPVGRVLKWAVRNSPVARGGKK